MKKLMLMIVLVVVGMLFSSTFVMAKDNHQDAEVAEKFMETMMNKAGYKTYCIMVWEEDTYYDIIMTSGSFKDSSSRDAIDNYIGAAVACAGSVTSQAQWKSKNLIIKVGFGEWYEISTYDCRKVVELFDKHQYQEASDYLFAHLKKIKNKR